MNLLKATKDDINVLQNNSLDIEVGNLPELPLGDISFSCFNNGTLLSCGGIVLFWPGVAEAWVVMSNKCNDLSNIEKTKVVLLVKHKMDELIKEHSLWRIGAIIRPDFPKAIKFAETLGFEYEGLLKKYAPDGKDRFIYGKVI